MYSYPCYSFVMSHNDRSGFDYAGQINEIVHSSETAQKAIAYIQSISSYSAYPRLVEASSTLHSMFTVNGYIFVVRTYPAADSRMFIEKQVTVIDTNQAAGRVYFDIEQTEGKKTSITEDIRDEKINTLFRCGLLLSAYNTFCKSFFIIRDDDTFAENLFYSIYKYLPKSLAGRIQCIETFSEFVNLDSEIYICRCLDDSDYEKILKRVEQYPTSAVLDFYAPGGVKADINLEKTTFSDAALMKLFEAVGGGGIKTVPVLLDRIAFDNLYFSKENMQAYYDAIVFLALYEKKPEELKKLKIDNNDFNALRMILRTMEEDF